MSYRPCRFWTRCAMMMVREMGYPDGERSNVTFLQRLLCNLVDFRASQIRKRADAH